MSSNPVQTRFFADLGKPEADPETGAALATAELSLPVRLGGRGLVGVAVPPGWDGANLTFQVADVDPNGLEANTSPAAAALRLAWRDLYDAEGREVCVTAAAARFVALPLSGPLAVGFAWVRVRSGTAASPVPQASPARLYLFARFCE